MRLFKKAAAALVSGAMVVSLAACAGTNTETTAAETTQAEETKTEETKAEETKTESAQTEEAKDGAKRIQLKLQPNQ